MAMKILHTQELLHKYRIIGNRLWKKKVCKFCESGSICKCFLALFKLSWNFYILDCLNRERFLANYGKEGNLRNFSSVDDSQYTVSHQEVVWIETSHSD